MEKYYVSGCKGLQGVVETCVDEQADFWTLYQRDEEGLSSALADFPSRKSAESAMAVYVERDALQKERDALAAENAAKGRCMAFLASVKSGEAWSETCQTQYDAASRGAPATDAFLNAVRAEGADKVADYHFVRIDALKDLSRQGHLFHGAPATDAFLNAVRAEGADKVADYHFVRIDALKDLSRQGHLFHKAAYSDAVNVAKLLRVGRDDE